MKTTKRIRSIHEVHADRITLADLRQIAESHAEANREAAEIRSLYGYYNRIDVDTDPFFAHALGVRLE